MTVSFQTDNCNSLRNYVVHLLKLENYDILTKNIRNFQNLLILFGVDKQNISMTTTTYLLLTVELEKMDFKKANFILHNSTANITFQMTSDFHTIRTSLKLCETFYNLGEILN